MEKNKIIEKAREQFSMSSKLKKITSRTTNASLWLFSHRHFLGKISTANPMGKITFQIVNV